MIPPVFPTTEKLAPWLAKLEAEPTGCVMLAITTSPDTANFHRVGWCFLNTEERTKLKRALQSINRKRKTEAATLTTEKEGR